MRILFLTEGVTTPSSRFRVHQFIPHFEKLGVACTVRHGYDASYNRINQLPVAPIYKLACRIRRALHAVEAPRHDLVFLQRPALPVSTLPETILHALNPHILFDFDDHIAMTLSGQVEPRRAEVLEHACQIASHVIAGNDYLATLTHRPDATTVLPTVIDTDLYTPRRARARTPDAPRILGWMGTAGNFKYLDPLWPQFARALDANEGWTMRLVSNAHNPLFDHPRVEQIAWSKEDEIELLRSFDVGIMPLEDTPAARGKCGFKLIQYMAVGVPVVASAVGVNEKLVEQGEAGLLVRDPEDWYETLMEMFARHDLDAMGQSGRAHIEEAYSIRGVLPRYMDLFARFSRA